MTSVTTMYDDVIRTVENGRPVGTVVKGKYILFETTRTEKNHRAKTGKR